MTKERWANLKVGEVVYQINRPTVSMNVAEVVDLNTEREARTKANWVRQGFSNPDTLVKLVNEKDGFEWHTWAVDENVWDIKE